jgi:hypothetical protein
MDFQMKGLEYEMETTAMRNRKDYNMPLCSQRYSNKKMKVSSKQEIITYMISE